MKKIIILISLLFATSTFANEKMDYSECADMNWVQTEICKTKVFQKTNWKSGREQLVHNKKQLVDNMNKIVNIVTGN